MPYAYRFVGTLPIKTLSGLVIARSFTRIVHGDRGAYVEFSPGQFEKANLDVLPEHEWRLHSTRAYYVEYRTRDLTDAKVYYQLRTVNYADYKVGMYYISPIKLQGFERTGVKYGE